MVGADGADGFHFVRRGVFERGYGDTLCDSRERSGDAGFGGQEHRGRHSFTLIEETRN
jgi:hypothetical protein